MAIGMAVILLAAGLVGGYFVGLKLAPSGGSGGGGTHQLTETGSSLLYPLMQIWGQNYTNQVNSGVILSPLATGSGTGQAQAEKGLVDIGASDGYLKNASQTNLINLPVAISAQDLMYNIPGVTAHLNLNGTVAAKIYANVITTWNDPEIQAANPGVTLPAQTIVPIIRSDSSGDTFLFTSFCYISWSGWTYGYANNALSGTKWTGAQGNSGVVQALHNTQYSIGYVGVSYQAQALALGGIQYAALGTSVANTASGGTNAANYVLPSAGNFSQDANLGLTHLQYGTYGLAISLILGGSAAGAINLTLGSGGSAPTSASPTPYPIVNLEYTLIKTTSTPNGIYTVQFLEWCIAHGNLGQYLSKVNFVPLTPTVAGYAMEELATVQI